MTEEVRVALRTANERISNLSREIDRLELAAERAEQAAQEATAEMEKHSELDKEITKWRVEQLKQGENTRALPDYLKFQLDAKHDATEELEQSRATQQAIFEELESLRERQRPAEQERLKCAITILHVMGDALASELASINHRRADLFQLLRGLERLEVPMDGDTPTAIGLSEYARNAMSMAETDVFPEGAEATAEIAERWKRRLETICASPYVEINPPSPVTPSDYVLEPSPGSWVPEHAA
jgi:chromosome segregation ATPase